MVAVLVVTSACVWNGTPAPDAVLHGPSIIPGFVSRAAIAYAYSPGSVVGPRMRTWIEASDNDYAPAIDNYGLVKLHDGTRVEVLENGPCLTLYGKSPAAPFVDMDIAHIRLPDSSQAWVSCAYLTET